jgi:putative Mg2+ transporter-C (MgtC) family protein
MDKSLIYDLNFNFEVCIPLLLALLCGMLIGAERSRSGHPAGMRTYALVCLGSALMVVVYSHPSLWSSVAGLRGIDPTRVVQGALTGIGFLGAGLIVREGSGIRGLTSASAVWVTAAIGLTIGSSFYLTGALVTGITLIVLTASHHFERLVPKYRFIKVALTVNAGVHEEEALVALFAANNFDLVHTHYRFDEASRGLEYAFLLRTSSPQAERRLVQRLKGTSEIYSFEVSPAGG